MTVQEKRFAESRVFKAAAAHVHTYGSGISDVSKELYYSIRERPFTSTPRVIAAAAAYVRMYGSGTSDVSKELYDAVRALPVAISVRAEFCHMNHEKHHENCWSQEHGNVKRWMA